MSVEAIIEWYEVLGTNGAELESPVVGPESCEGWRETLPPTESFTTQLVCLGHFYIAKGGV